MSNYEIFVDSTTDLAADMAEQLGLHVIPYIYTLDGKDYHNYLDYRELSVQDFYNALRAEKTASTTQVTAHRYLEAWRPFLEDGKDVVYMCLSSMLSKSYEQSLLAAREAEESFPGRRVIAIDSKSASLGQGLLAVMAARARDAGKTRDELAAYIEGLVPKIQHWIMADDLHHLKRGGRISGAKAVIGTMLNVKPVLTIGTSGKLAPVSKARGRNKALALFLEQLEKYKYDGGTVCIAHSDVPELAAQFKEMLAEKGVTDVITNEIGPVIGAHTGPGTIALVFAGEGARENVD
ncbi:MAG: DegV family protein [Defluviitaleaceae bacterium]|nr:DegV family protein [Defluviitaleaceae bacterium]MCL2263448.1 DegV family protein [Defluviitaleaceae bacterium]